MQRVLRLVGGRELDGVVVREVALIAERLTSLLPKLQRSTRERSSEEQVVAGNERVTASELATRGIGRIPFEREGVGCLFVEPIAVERGQVRSRNRIRGGTAGGTREQEKQRAAQASCG